MYGWLIYNKNDANENGSYIEWFIDEGKKQSVDILLIYREYLTIGMKNDEYVICYKNNPIRLPQFVVIRTIEPLLQHIFESLLIPTFNSYRVATIANHKSLTYMEMNRIDIPILPTYFTTKQTLPTNPPLRYPFVVKEANGRGGKQVYYIQDEHEWDQLKQKICATDLIIQDANVQLGKDVRVFVIGKQIIAAILRKNENDFRANFKLGGSAHVFTLSNEQKLMIQKIINHFDFGLVGIDFLINNENELVFNEIEDVVGSRILSATTNINLLEKYVTFIKKSVLNK